MHIMPRAIAQTMRARLMRVQLVGGARGTCYVRCIASYSLVFVVSKPRWPRRAVIPDLHLHRQRPHISLELSISECVTIDYLIWPMPMVCNDILRDIPERDPPRTYVRTYIRTL